MQAIMETLFDAAYLVTVVTLGCIMVKSAQDRETKLFGWMAVILGCGDAREIASSVCSALWRWYWAQAMRFI